LKFPDTLIRADNPGGRCSRCGKLCCKDCLTIIDDEMFCPTCLRKLLKTEHKKILMLFR